MPSVRELRLKSLACACGLALALVTALPWPATAQLALPGAFAPAPAGTRETPRRVRPRPRAPAAVPVHLGTPHVIPPSALAGKTLSLNGGKSQITFEPHDKDIDVAHLTLTGETMTDARGPCEVEAPNTPIAVTDAGHPDGIERVQLDFPACPIMFEVLDGAALVEPSQAVCEFKPASCRVNPAGLWGPQSGDLGPDKQKGIEHARAQAEGAVRANFKGLVAATKDKVAIMDFARDQAQFSSTREETCRDYAGEGRHGYCATKLTEARAAVLRAKLDDALLAKAERKKKHDGRAVRR